MAQRARDRYARQHSFLETSLHHSAGRGSGGSFNLAGLTVPFRENLGKRKILTQGASQAIQARHGSGLPLNLGNRLVGSEEIAKQERQDENSVSAPT